MVERLAVFPVEQDGRKGFRFEGQGTYAKLLPGGAEPPKASLAAATSDGVPSGIRTRVVGLKVRTRNLTVSE